MGRQDVKLLVEYRLKKHNCRKWHSRHKCVINVAINHITKNYNSGVRHFGVILGNLCSMRILWCSSLITKRNMYQYHPVGSKLTYKILSWLKNYHCPFLFCNQNKMGKKRTNWYNLRNKKMTFILIMYYVHCTTHLIQPTKWVMCIAHDETHVIFLLVVGA